MLKHCTVTGLSTALASVVFYAGAQGYPTKPVRIVVPFPPGQAADTFSRLTAIRLSQVWGQNIVVDNRAGGGGVPGVMLVKQAAPDGYTILVGTSGTVAVNPNVYTKIPYDPVKDFAPASNIFIVPLVIIAHPSFAPRTIAELIAAAKAKPASINYASAGPGTAQHMTGELFKSKAGIDLVHVPYKGSGPGIIDLVGGQVPIMVDSQASALPYIKSGKIRVIAVTTAARTPQLPEAPTVAEAGFAGFEGVGWSGFLLPAGTPRDIVEKISRDTQAALREPALRERIVTLGAIPDPRTPKQYSDFIRAEIIQWGEVARVAKVKLD